jgi:HlyD family secretion protein
MSSIKPSLEALRIDRTVLPQRSPKPWWWLILLALLLGGGAVWWFTKDAAQAVKTAAVRLQASGGTAGGNRTLLNASGYVIARREATVSSKLTGKVIEVNVEEGKKVQEGDILAKLDASNVESSLRLAEAQAEAARLALAEIEPNLAYAQAEFKRLSSLAPSSGVSQTELGKMEAELKSFQAKLVRQTAEVAVAQRTVDMWKQQLDDNLIRAPFSGIVTTKNSQPGEMISPMSAGGFTRTGICTLVDMASLEIEVDVSESYINRVQAGQPVAATLDAYPEEKFPAKVIAIIPTADRQKATVKVRVGFEKIDPRMLPQMGVKVAFQAPEAAPSEAPSPARVLTIPKSAVQKVAGKDIVWVVVNGKTERRAITIAATVGEESTVSAGLSQGENVVLNPPAKLVEGTRVSVDD